MTTLSIFHQNQPEQAQTVVTDPDTIRNKLSAHGVNFDRWALCIFSFGVFLSAFIVKNPKQGRHEHRFIEWLLFR